MRPGGSCWRLGRASMASRAFFTRFVTACVTRRRSKGNISGFVICSTSIVISAELTRCRTVASFTTLARSWSSSTALGMRAKDENSSTMRPISPTCRMIVSVHCSKTCLSVWISLPYLRLSRSAESWIGVSGFLISWAMRRAISAQAELRCAETSSVMSSKVTTWPCSASSERSVVTRTMKLRSFFADLTLTWPSAEPEALTIA